MEISFNIKWKRWEKREQCIRKKRNFTKAEKLIPNNRGEKEFAFVESSSWT